jgi:hypothetical protein
LTSLHRPRAQAESSVAMSFATNGVREKAGSAGLKRDGSVARKHLCLGPRRRRDARVPAAMLVWLSASSGPRARAYQVCSAPVLPLYSRTLGLSASVTYWWSPRLQQGSGEIADPRN